MQDGTISVDSVLVAVFIAVVVVIGLFVVLNTRKQVKMMRSGSGFITWGKKQERTRRFDEALKCYLTAEEVYRKAGDEAGRVRAYNHAGLVMLRCDDFKGARDFFRKGEPIARKYSSPEDLGVLLTNLGDVEEGLGNAERSKQYYTEAMEIYEEDEDMDGVMFMRDKLKIETEPEDESD